MTSTYSSTSSPGGCNAAWTGDMYCDDINNNMECGYDGGDCCGCDVHTDYCTECQCLDPNGSGGGTTCPPITTTTHNPGNYAPVLNYSIQTGKNMLLIKYFSVLAYGTNLIVGVLTLCCGQISKIDKTENIKAVLF